MNSVLEVINVTKKIGKKTILNNISFTINKNDKVGLVGINGAGKTTLFKVLLGLQKIDIGTINIFGNNINNKKIFNRINALIENPSFYNYLTGYQNLIMIADLYNTDKKNIDSLINLYKLTPFINKKVSTYSLGMKQKLGIVKTMINNPDLIILDEPTNGLDPININDFIKYIKQSKNKTFIISSHNLDYLSKICNRIIIINNGKIIYDKKNNKKEKLNKIFIEKLGLNV